MKKSNNKCLLSPLSVFKRKRKERIQREEIFYTGETPIRSNILLEKQPLQAILDSGSSLNIINEVLWKRLKSQNPSLIHHEDSTIIEGLSQQEKE